MVSMQHDSTDWTIGVEVDAVLRGQGMDPAAVRARAPRVVAAAEAAIVQGRGLLRPRVVSREYIVVRHERDGLVLEGGELRCGEGLAARLGGARRLVVVGVTVSDDLLDHAAELIRADPMVALGMQGTGAAAVEDLAVQACRAVSLAASQAGESGVLCWPGSAEWPNAEAQRQIFALLGEDDPDGGALRVDEYGILRPVTSITFAVAVGADHERAAELGTRAAQEGEAERDRAPRPGAAGAGAGGAELPCDICGKIPVCNFAGC
jgi:hypothetical protein